MVLLWFRSTEAPNSQRYVILLWFTLHRPRVKPHDLALGQERFRPIWTRQHI